MNGSNEDRFLIVSGLSRPTPFAKSRSGKGSVQGVGRGRPHLYMVSFISPSIRGCLQNHFLLYIM